MIKIGGRVVYTGGETEGIIEWPHLVGRTATVVETILADYLAIYAVRFDGELRPRRVSASEVAPEPER